MLQHISWSQYFLTLIVATIFYYLFLWLFIYKGKLNFFPAITNLRSLSLYADDAPDEVMTTAQQVIDELRPLIQRDSNQQELLYAIQQRLIKYNAWEEPGFRDTVNAFILGAFETTCSIRLREHELRALWPMT